jgi:hypothetical protein
MPYGSATAVGSSASGWMVGFREKGSLATAQWNFVSDWVMFAVANWESRFVNQDCGESA